MLLHCLQVGCHDNCRYLGNDGQRQLEPSSALAVIFVPQHRLTCDFNLLCICNA